MTNTPFIEFIIVLFILASLIPLINNIITGENCNYNNNLCPIKRDIDIINYYSKGINYSSLNSSSYDITFLACVNKFYECGYMLSNNESTDYSNNGVKIGFGVDLGGYNETTWKTLEMPESALEKVKPFFEKKGDSALNQLLSMEFNLTLTYEEAYNISLKHIASLQQNIQTAMRSEDSLNNTFIITPLLSVVLLFNANETIKNAAYVDSSCYITNTGNYIANLLTNMTTVKQTQSLAITALNNENDKSNYNSALISIVVDTSISKDDFSATYKGELTSIIQRMPFEIALVGYHGDADIIFSFNRDIASMDAAVEQYTHFDQDVVMVTKGIQKADELFTNKLKVTTTTYTKRIIILIMNKESNDNKRTLSQMISQYKTEKGYNFIIIGTNNVTTNYYEDILGETSNIIYVNGFNQQNQDTKFLPHVIYTSIKRQHISIQMNNVINNLVIHSINEPHYFKVNVLNTFNKKYIIQLRIHNVQHVDYQIYISTKTPYPNINEYDIKHLGNIYTSASHNATQPYLILLIEDTSNTIYISVESEHLIYNITINECDRQYNECNSNNSISNGLYGTKELNETIGVDNMYYSFVDCYKKKCFIDETTLIKYFARGLTIFNTNDNANRDETFINSHLFSCLYSLYYCAYVDQHGKGHIGDPQSINLTDKESLKSVNEQIPKLLFNKIRPLFIKDDNTTSHKQLLQKENIYFTYNETMSLYNITFQTYMNNMNHSLSDCLNCPNKFYQLDINWRFILFMNSFTNENDFFESMEDVSKMNSIDYLRWRFSNTTNKNENELLQCHIQSVLLHSLYNGFNEKCLISLIAGKSLIYTSQFSSFLRYLIDSFNEQKISITLYNEDNERFERLFDFHNKSDSIISIIKTYPNNTKESTKQTGTLYVDDIINNEIPRFANYDKGIKRVILIIGDENLNVEDNKYINHEMTIKSENAFTDIRHQLTKASVNVMLITSKALEQKHSTYMNKYLNCFTDDEVFTISNFTQINEAHQNISTAIRQLIVQIPMTFEIINDFYESNLYYYEIDLTPNLQFQQLSLSFSSDKINVYYSYKEPYPTNFSKDGDCLNQQKCDIINNGTEYEKLYITFEPTDKLIFFKAKICEWDSTKERCKNMNDISIITALVLLVCGFGLFVYGTVSCKSGNQNVKKKINIFN